MIYFITGKPSSGKTFLSHKLWTVIYENFQEKSLILDGDQIREIFSDLEFTDEDRRKNIERISKIALLAEKQGIPVIISLVSPKKIWRDEARYKFSFSKLIHVIGPEEFLWENTFYEQPEFYSESCMVYNRTKKEIFLSKDADFILRIFCRTEPGFKVVNF